VRLTLFQAGTGDCLLLTGKDGTSVLVDGGMSNAFRSHVVGALATLAEEGRDLELVYVSHIDRDHISGVLQLLDDVVAWRVFDFQRERGNDRFPEPRRPRPPRIHNVWHNGFHEQVRANRGDVEEVLAASAPILELSGDPAMRPVARLDRELASSVAEGIELSRRIGPEQLGIPLNAHFRGRLAMARRDQRPVRLGSMRIAVIGPFRAELEKLRSEWNRWLSENSKQLAALQRRMARDAARLVGNEVAALSEALALAASELGDIGRVTPPNLASLMLHVEEDGRTILLTGDGHATHILRGLELTKKLDRRGRIHVDVLKVQHHGSEYNIDEAFLERVSADTYVFCGNGEHENPDLRVVRLVIDSRVGPGAAPTGPRASPFTLRFTSSSRAAPPGGPRDHMGQVEALVAEAHGREPDRFTFAFLDDSSATIDLN
jgi:hypothetical protein